MRLLRRHFHDITPFHKMAIYYAAADIDFLEDGHYHD